MGINLIELKDYLVNERVYCFEVSSIGLFLDWQGAMLDEDKVKEYIKNNPFPKDKYYDAELFLTDIDSEGTIRIGVENKETAEYIRDMFQELI